MIFPDESYVMDAMFLVTLYIETKSISYYFFLKTLKVNKKARYKTGGKG